MHARGPEHPGGEGKQRTALMWLRAHISQNQSCGSREGRPGPALDRKEVSHSASQVSLGTSCKDPQYRLLGPHKVSSVKTEEPDAPKDKHRRSGTGPGASACRFFLEVGLGLLGAGICPEKNVRLNVLCCLLMAGFHVSNSHCC